MLTLSLILLCIAIFIMVRNMLVFNAWGRAIEIVHSSPNWEVESERYFRKSNWSQPHGYDWMMFDLTKWTFKQFYPELAQRGMK